MFLGATGTGKTTFEATASGFLQRFDPLMFVVDYNRSTELFVRAYGGAISHCRKVSIPAAIRGNWQKARNLPSGTDFSHF